jgi:hypothetical protein
MAHKESTSSLHLQTYDKQRCSDIPGCCFWQTSSVPRGAQLKTPPPLSSPVQQPSQTEQNFQMIIYGNMSCPCSNVHTTSSTVHSTIFSSTYWCHIHAKLNPNDDTQPVYNKWEGEREREIAYSILLHWSGPTANRNRHQQCRC